MPPGKCMNTLTTGCYFFHPYQGMSDCVGTRSIDKVNSVGVHCQFIYTFPGGITWGTSHIRVLRNYTPALLFHKEYRYLITQMWPESGQILEILRCATEMLLPIFSAYLALWSGQFQEEVSDGLIVYRCYRTLRSTWATIPRNVIRVMNVRCVSLWFNARTILTL